MNFFRFKKLAEPVVDSAPELTEDEARNECGISVSFAQLAAAKYAVISIERRRGRTSELDDATVIGTINEKGEPCDFNFLCSKSQHAALLAEFNRLYSNANYQ